MKIHMFKRILVPTDNSEITEKAVKLAIELAKVHNATIYALSVSEPFYYASDMALAASPNYYEEQRELAHARVMKVFNACVAENVSCETRIIDAPQPWREIVECAIDTHCDLIVMASHGRRGLLGFLLGSETHRVLTHTKIPLLVVR